MCTYHERDFDSKVERKKPKQFGKIYSIPSILWKIP